MAQARGDPARCTFEELNQGEPSLGIESGNWHRHPDGCDHRRAVIRHTDGNATEAHFELLQVERVTLLSDLFEIGLELTQRSHRLGGEASHPGLGDYFV
jgi:hypothetical protein